MQILHSFSGSIQEYEEEIADPRRYRPDRCPQCQAAHELIAHGFYRRTLVDRTFDGSIRVRRYLCRSCKRTVSLLPQFALPYLRFGITVIALFLIARLLRGHTLGAAAAAAALSDTRAKKAPVAASSASAPREGSKTRQVIAMLQREGGTTLEEIMTAMGWQKHTTRAMLSAGGSLTKNHGLVITSEKVGDKRTYSIKA